MIRVEISFDTYKHLMLRRRDETHSLDDVIRELAGLEPAPPVGRRAWFQKDLSLRHGTELRAPYKGAFYPAAIVDGEWIQNGEVMDTTYDPKWVNPIPRRVAAAAPGSR